MSEKITKPFADEIMQHNWATLEPHPTDGWLLKVFRRDSMCVLWALVDRQEQVRQLLAAMEVGDELRRMPPTV